jgi:predicted exporter
MAVYGYYYITAAQNELVPFFWASIFARVAVLVCFILLVVTKKAKPMLISFGVIDAAGAIWTFLTLN